MRIKFGVKNIGVGTYITHNYYLAIIIKFTFEKVYILKIYNINFNLYIHINC